VGYTNESKGAIENNAKWDLPLDIWIILYSNRCRDGYRTRIFFSSIYIHGSFCIISADFKPAGIRLEYFDYTYYMPFGEPRLYIYLILKELKLALWLFVLDFLLFLFKLFHSFVMAFSYIVFLNNSIRLLYVHTPGIHCGLDSRNKLLEKTKSSTNFATSNIK
jgi:hypothetical protein